MAQETYGYEAFLLPLTWRYVSQVSCVGNG